MHLLARLTRTAAPGPAASPVQAPGHLVDVFTPTRPRQGQRQLTGRKMELARVVTALVEERTHVVLYSERGRGKTSLANSVVEVLRRGELAVARYTCDAASSFEDIVRGLARDLPASLLAVPAGAGQSRSGLDGAVPQAGCGAALPPGGLHPADVVGLPSRLTCPFLVCVVDEFDRVRGPVVRTLVADTIKQLSDRGARLVFMLVGVSDSLERLLGEHGSIQRSVAGMALPLLSAGQVGELVARGAREADIIFAPDLVARIAVLSRGMPYMAQLLGLRVAQAAAARQATQAGLDDLATAAARLVLEAEQRVVSLHAELTCHDTDRAMGDALHAVATADQDILGRMRVGIGAATVRVGEAAIPAGCWRRIVEAGVVAAQAVGVSAAGDGAPAIAAVSDRGLMNHVLLLGVLQRPAAEPARAARPGVAVASVSLAEQG